MRLKATNRFLQQTRCLALRRGMATEDIEEAHRLAVHLNKNTYEDPVTKYQVFTSKWLESRGNCCGFKCRHCPYGHFAVQSPSVRNNLVKKAVLINTSKAKNELNHCDFMVYNGDKESIAMLVNYEQERRETVSEDTKANSTLVLIALVDESTGVVITSKKHCYDIFDQCKQLNLPLYVLPSTESENIHEVLENGLMALEMKKSNRKVFIPLGFPETTGLMGLRADRFTYTHSLGCLDDAKYEQIFEIIQKEARYSIFDIK